MFVKPSVTFLRLPLRSGTRTDCRMPPYVRIETDMPRVLVSVYLSIAVPLARAPKLDFEMRGDWAPARRGGGAGGEAGEDGAQRRPVDQAGPSDESHDSSSEGNGGGGLTASRPAGRI